VDIPLSGKLAIVAATAGTFFALGAYYQHQHVIRNIKKLEQRNPHAYFIRRKLYALLDIFNVHTAIDVYEDSHGDADSHKMSAIMKYGFPSMNEISLNETYNFVTSFDRRNSAIQWMCERVEPSSYTNAANPQNMSLSMRHRPYGTPPDFTFQHAEAARVFFMSNIKPFINRGFNAAVWERLLHYIHEMSQTYGDVYVYTGSIYLPREMKSNNWYLEFQPEDNTIIAVPTHFFKIIIIDPKQANSTPYAEAYVLPNTTINDRTELRTLLSDVRDIENATGLKFFEGLDRNFVNTQVSN
ncbi:hypothetical protein KR222_005370, partial [Zaprionus bogoriensis]